MSPETAKGISQYQIELGRLAQTYESAMAHDVLPLKQAISVCVLALPLPV